MEFTFKSEPCRKVNFIVRSILAIVRRRFVERRGFISFMLSSGFFIGRFVRIIAGGRFGTIIRRRDGI